MKKYLLTVGLLIFCLMLAACTATDPNNLFETTAGDPADTTTSAIATTESTEPSEESKASEFDGSVMFEEGYQYGNMQKSPRGKFLRFGNEVLFQYITNGKDRLYSYDLATGEVGSYCKDATCRHNACVASRLLGNLEVYKGEIYTLTFERIPVRIDDMERIPLTKAQVSSFWHYNDQLYARTGDSSLVVFEEGQDKPRLLVEEFPCFWEVIFGQYLYATDGNSVLRVDLSAEEPSVEVLIPNAVGITDGQHFYYADLKNYFLYRCDMDGSNSELLLEQPVLPASWNFDDEYFYYRLYTDYQLDDGPDTYDIYRFPKSDPAKIEKLATLPVPAYQVFTVPGTDKLFVNTRVRSNGEDDDIYVMNTDGSSITRLEIPEY